MKEHNNVVVELELSIDKSLDVEKEVERLMLIVKKSLQDENYIEGYAVKINGDFVQ